MLYMCQAVHFCISLKRRAKSLRAGKEKHVKKLLSYDLNTRNQVAVCLLALIYVFERFYTF